MKKNLVFTISEEAGKHRVDEFVRIGIPLPIGQFYEAEQVDIGWGQNPHIPAEVVPTAYWHDKSIKWCLLSFLASMDANEQREIHIAKSDNAKLHKSEINLISESGNLIEIKTGNLTFQLNKDEFRFIDRIVTGNNHVVDRGYCRLSINGKNNCRAIIEDYSIREAHSQSFPLYAEFICSGYFKDTFESEPLKFETRLRFIYASDRLIGSITLHNPRRVLHPSGLWDLGDSNSIYIDEFSIGMDIFEATGIEWKLDSSQRRVNSTQNRLCIYQESSGGRNWDSPNHKNRNNRVDFKLKGFTCETAEESTSGDRASPVVSVLGNKTRVNLSINRFWQNFPSALSVNKGRIDIGLFPKQFPDEIELQGGEKKTHSFSLSFSEKFDDFEELNSPLNIIMNPDWLIECKVFAYEFLDERSGPIRNLINLGIEGDSSFFAKREVIDEYGWRNFGDLYADHEADLQANDDIFVSHYNNQYDPLFGFLFQYLISGNALWFELAQDLAQHATDIDIYHTELDRDEYNGGPFWHTDHYLDAATSSHRSHSRFHDYQFEGYAGGGGPGGQHCYTSGLLLHYLLTGTESSKNAIFQICEWITNFYESSGSCFDYLVALKNSSYIDRTNFFTGQYPLDRGTAYYLNTVLDKFYLTGDRADLAKAEHIIRNTISPADDLQTRELTDIENRWHYTVFLQSLIRYLQVKTDCRDMDDDFYYARDTLLIYAQWMLSNEYPYLEKPEILQFPNHTWTAQDIRKAHIFYNAAYYSNENKERYLERANEFYSYVSNTLKAEPSRTYTRILAILMQTPISQHKLFEERKSEFRFEDNRTYTRINRSAIFYRLKTVMSGTFRALGNLSLKREIDWLDKRTRIVSKLKGKA